MLAKLSGKTNRDIQFDPIDFPIIDRHMGYYDSLEEAKKARFIVR